MADASWVVVRQDQDQYDFTAPGNPVLGAVVHFQTGEGNDGSVFVAYNHYNAKTVRDMVAVRARIVDEIGALSAGGA